MLTDVTSARVHLGKGQHLRLRGAFGTRVTCVNGATWITFEDDAGDIVISHGNAYVLPPGKTALVGPLGQSATLDLRHEADVVRQEPRSRADLAGMLGAVLGQLRLGSFGRVAAGSQGVT